MSDQLTSDIRPGRPSDEPAVLALTTACATSFAVEPAAFRPAFAQMLEAPDGCLLVAEDDGRVIGYVLGFLHPTFYANGPVAWVEEITVDQALRGRGVGRRLMDGFEVWALARDARLVALATRRAAPFYLALGYAESATYFRKLLVGP